ncbi:MAG: ABC transporter substrate-binding protein [Candidatus Parcubacteria bacterium]|nr:ABC transporter substrate-binding protein [Candidatus Parcubacteria bacterium]
MNFLFKFFSDLKQNLQNFVYWRFENFSKLKKISKQNDHDKKIVATLSHKQLPSWKQFKRLSHTLNKTESLLIKIFSVIILLSLIFLFYTQVWQKLKTVPKNGGEFAEGIVGSPLYLNPILASGLADVDTDLTRLIYSGLLKYNEKLELVPDLAERYEISNDQKTYTFYLRKNAKWHDGDNLTAADVVFTIKSIQDPDFKSPLERTFAGVKIEMTDEYTVKFTLNEPYAAFLNILTVGIIPQHIWYDIPALNAKLAVSNQKPIGSGPFKFKSLVKEKSGLIKVYTLEKNKNYYGKIPYINNIIFKFFPDYQSAVDDLINKNIQSLSYLPKEYLKKINKRDLNFYNFPLSQYTAVFFNSKNNKLLDNKKIKEALSYALDKNKIIEDVLQNQGLIIDGPILPGFLGYTPDLKKYEYNPPKAIELLASDGWSLSGETLKKKDQELKITLTTVDQSEYIKVANLIKEFWTSIGINVEIKPVAKDQFEKEVITPRNYEALLYGEIIGYDPDLFSFWHSSQKEAPGVNLANYVNRKADQLLEEARQTNAQGVRNKKYQEFQNILIDDLPAIFLYSPDYTYPVNKKIKGLEVEKIALPADRFINIENWFLKTKKQFFK